MTYRSLVLTALSHREPDRHRDTIERFDYPAFADEPIEAMVERARSLRRQSDRAAILNLQAHMLAAAAAFGGW